MELVRNGGIELFRVLCCLSIVAFHTCEYTLAAVRTLPEAVYLKPLAQSGLGLYYVVDGFLVLTGFLLARKALAKDRPGVDAAAGAAAPAFHWDAMLRAVSRRLLRLAPEFYLAVLVYYLFLQHPDRMCRPIISFLFLHNFVPTSAMCIDEAWYVAVDVHAVAFFGLVVYRNAATLLPRAAKALAAAAVFRVAGILIAWLAPPGWFAPAMLPCVIWEPDGTQCSTIWNHYLGAVYCHSHFRIASFLVGVVAAALPVDTVKRWQEDGTRRGGACLVAALVLIQFVSSWNMYAVPKGAGTGIHILFLSTCHLVVAVAMAVLLLLGLVPAKLDALPDAVLAFARLSYPFFLVHGRIISMWIPFWLEHHDIRQYPGVFLFITFLAAIVIGTPVAIALRAAANAVRRLLPGGLEAASSASSLPLTSKITSAAYVD